MEEVEKGTKARSKSDIHGSERGWQAENQQNRDISTQHERKRVSVGPRRIPFRRAPIDYWVIFSWIGQNSEKCSHLFPVPESIRFVTSHHFLLPQHITVAWCSERIPAFQIKVCQIRWSENRKICNFCPFKGEIRYSAEMSQGWCEQHKLTNTEQKSLTWSYDGDKKNKNIFPFCSFSQF